jgi:Tol biopolymer transport system component
MNPVGRLLLRTSAAAVLAAMLAATALCAGASATAAPAPMMTYITDLDKPAPQVWVSGIGGSSAVDLGPASSALISPNGSDVAAIAIQKGQAEKNWTLSLYSTSGGSPVSVVASVQFMQLLAWSPDSDLILVEIGASPAQLRVVDAATGQGRTIATGLIAGASFAPDGSDRVVYARAAVNSTRVNIYTTSSTGANTRQLTHDGRSEFPLWGQTGIVYSHETPRPKNPYPALQLWSISQTGKAARRLTDTPVAPNVEGLTPIAFSADGKHLLANFIGPQGSNHAEAYAVDLSGAKPSAPRDITGQGNGDVGDAISADGNTILLTEGLTASDATPSVETVPWTGGKPTAVIPQGAYASWNL